MYNLSCNYIETTVTNNSQELAILLNNVDNFNKLLDCNIVKLMCLQDPASLRFLHRFKVFTTPNNINQLIDGIFLIDTLEKPSSTDCFVNLLKSRLSLYLSYESITLKRGTYGNTILHKIISNAAAKHFNENKMIAALKTYFDFIHKTIHLLKSKDTCSVDFNQQDAYTIISPMQSSNLLTKEVKNLLTLQNHEGQSAIDTLVLKSKKLSPQFIKEFFVSKLFYECNHELNKIFDKNSLNGIFISNKTIILNDMYSFPESIQKAFLGDILYYIKHYYPTGTYALKKSIRSALPMEQLSNDLLKGNWQNNEDLKSIAYYLISYGIHYNESQKLFTNNDNISISKELNLKLNNEYLVFTNTNAKSNMLLIIGAYNDNDILSTFASSFHNKGFNICAINTNRYTYPSNVTDCSTSKHIRECYKPLKKELVDHIANNIKNCNISSFSSVVIHMHGNPNAIKNPEDVVLKLYNKGPAVLSNSLITSIKDFFQDNVHIMLTSCNGQLVLNMFQNTLKQKASIITFGEYDNSHKSVSTRAEDVENLAQHVNEFGINFNYSFTSQMICHYLMHLTNISSLNVPIPTYSNFTITQNWTKYDLVTYSFSNHTIKDSKYNDTIHQQKNCYKKALCNPDDVKCHEKFNACIQKDSCLLSNIDDMRTSVEEFGVSGAIEIAHYQGLC